jgi:hypothetical protein
MQHILQVYTIRTCHEIAQVAHPHHPLPLTPIVLSPCVEIIGQVPMGTKGQARNFFVEGC